jgi:hypothetical protein
MANLKDRYYHSSSGKWSLIISVESLIFICRPTLICWYIGCQQQNFRPRTHPATSQDDFRAALIQHDITCVVTGDVAESCDASQYLPHAKVDGVHLSFDFDFPPSQIFTPALAVGNQLL